MRFLPSLAAAGLLLAGSAAFAKSDPEAQLAKELEGRVAGAPVSCISLERIHATRIIDRTAIIYDAGSTIYVNRPRGGAETLDNWDVLVSKPFGSQLCSPGVVQLYERGSRIQSGFVTLDKFVPYKKVKTARAD
jgi:hypothetical protein